MSLKAVRRCENWIYTNFLDGVVGNLLVGIS